MMFMIVIGSIIILAIGLIAYFNRTSILNNCVHYGVQLHSLGWDAYRYVTNIPVAKCKANGTMEIVYYHNNVKYCVISPVALGRRPISKIMRDNEDVTESVRKYMGPFGNFHGVSTTPQMLGFDKEIKVVYRNDVSVTYKNNEVISLVIPAVTVADDNDKNENVI